MPTQDICLILAGLPLLWIGWWLLKGLGLSASEGHWGQVSLSISGWLLLPTFLIVVAGLVGILMALNIHVSTS